MRGFLVLMVGVLVGCSGRAAAPDAATGSGEDAGAGSVEREAEILAICDQFSAAGCPIGMPLGYGEDCMSWFAILDHRSERTGCSAENRAWFDCVGEQTCEAWSECAALASAADACRETNAGGDTCLLACEASIASSCDFTVSGCTSWCTRKEAERVIAGCTSEGEALDDCLTSTPDVCASDACTTEAERLTACLGG